MKLATILLVLGFVLFANTGSYTPWFNYFKPELKREVDYYEVSVPVLGGSGSYEYRYYDLPYRWRFNGKYIQVPYKYYTYDTRYYVPVSVYDISYQTYLKKTLVFNFLKDYSVKVYVRPFDYKVITVVDDTCNYPSDNMIEMLVKEGDVDELEKIIDSIIHCTKDSCSKRAKFLKSLLSKITLYIGFYKVNIEDLNDKIKGAKYELAKLVEAKNDLTLAQELVGSTYKLEREVRNLKNEQAFLENRINDDKDQIRKHNNRIGFLETQIKDNDNELRDLEEKNAIHKSEIKNILWKIKEDAGPLADLIAEKAIHESKIVWNNKKIWDLKEESDDLKDTIDWIIRQITFLEGRIDDDTLDLWKVKALIKENEAKLEAIAGEELAIILKIKRVSDDIDSQKIVIAALEFDLLVLESSKKTLEVSFADFDKKIDVFYYKCYDVEIVYTVSRDPLFYTITPSSYVTYVKKVYDFEPEPVPEKYKYKVYDVSYADPSWVKSYGYPVVKKAFTTDFVCEKHLTTSYTGTIYRINGNIIYIRDKASVEYELHLGSCSIIQSVTGFSYARVGDKIYYKGLLRGSSSYIINASIALCY